MPSKPRALTLTLGLVLCGLMLGVGCSSEVTGRQSASAAPREDAERTPDLVALIEEYEAATNAGDVEEMMGFYTEDAVWETLKRDERIPRDEFRPMLVTDRALDVSVDYLNCRQEGLELTCDLIEDNAWLELHGLGSWRGSDMKIWFTEEGKIARVRSGSPDEELYPELAAHWMAFEEWALENDRDLFVEKIVDAEKRKLRFGEESARALLELGRRWAEAERPGLEAARERFEEKRREMQEREQREAEKGAQSEPSAKG